VARPEHISQLRPGDTLGGYKLLMTVGSGGMGKVWAARRVEATAQHIVAVKTALEEMAGDEQFERMLLDEARIAASIVHPNVCAIREVGSERGIAYLVMDWMDAGSLLDLMAACPNRRMDPFVAVRIISNVASGLHAAHELTGEDGSLLNVVHRDVSPQNVLLSSAGHVKVADFGVAKAKGQLHAPTETGEVKGKLSYMAPEQLTSKIFDRRADVFALGCCLYEVTTGERPFHGGDALETMYKLLETDCVLPSSIVEGYPVELEKIVLRTLEKEPEKRFQTADELRVALEGLLAKTGRLVTDRDVAELVRACLSSTLDRKAQALKDATSSAMNSHTGSRKTGLEVTETENGAAGKTPRTWNTDPPQQSRRLRERVVFGAVTASLLIAVLVWMRKPPTDASNLKSNVNSAITQAATPAPLVTVTIRTEPPEARVRVDDGPPEPSPHVVVTVPSQQLHGVVISLDGYESLLRQMAFDQSQDIILGLRRRTDEPSPTPSAQSTKGPKSASVASTRTAQTDTSTSVSDILNNKRKRPKRQIDSSNPFADP